MQFNSLFLDLYLWELRLGGKPIVFAAHSQGGLVVQRYLVQQLDVGKGP